MTGHEENYQPVGSDGVGTAWIASDWVTAAKLNELEKRIGDELKKIAGGIRANGVISGYEVTERGAGVNQTVDVGAGICCIDGKNYVKTGTTNVELDAAHSSYARWDIITYDASEDMPAKVTGTAGAVPTIPDIPAGDIILALVLRIANDNTIQDADITDKRMLIKPQILSFTPSDDLLHANDAEVTSISDGDELEKKKTIRPFLTGEYRIKFKLHMSSEGGHASGRIYKNGEAYGILRQTNSVSYVEFSEDLRFSEGDTCELWIAIWSSGETAYAKDFRIHGEANYSDYGENE